VTRSDPHSLRDANDPLLAPLIDAVDEQKRLLAMEQVLAECVRPTIEMVLKRYRGSDRSIRAEEAEDIAAIATLRVLRKLQNAAVDVDDAITNLADFTATLTYNAIYDVFRSRYPERTRLRNRIRHTLANDPRFATWETAAGMVCGSAGMSGAEATHSIIRFEANVHAPLGDTIDELFCDQGPVTFGDLVQTMATSLGIRESNSPRETELWQEAEQLTKLEQRQHLENLWKEIRDLSVEHRVALLLNLREAGGGNAVALFIGLGIASIDEVAAAVGLTVDRLAALWSRLPLDDHTIAEMLGVTRQKVINYRRSARDRVARRTSAPIIERARRP
jgi:hypothetical protein